MSSPLKKIRAWWHKMGAAERRHVIIVILLLAAFLAPTAAAIARGVDWSALSLDLAVEMGGVLVVYLLLDRLLSQPETPKIDEAAVGAAKAESTLDPTLIERLRGPDRNGALTALEVLRRRGALMDGTMTGIDLSRASLRGANLAWADWRGVNLAWADLRGANFWGANMQDGDLAGADLGGANLQESAFRGGSLEGADLRRCIIEGADFGGAKLAWANLREAAIRDTDLRGADLTGADLRGAAIDVRHGMFDETTRLPDGKTRPPDADWEAELASFTVWEDRIP